VLRVLRCASQPSSRAPENSTIAAGSGYAPLVAFKLKVLDISSTLAGTTSDKATQARTLRGRASLGRVPCRARDSLTGLSGERGS
jgi:hypothetical protein